MANTNTEKKPNFFARIGAGISRFWRNYMSEMKKVVWMSKKDVKKNTLIVIVMVLVVSIAILAVDLTFSEIINGIAGLIG